MVFLFYAEDAGLFEKGQFHDYLKGRQNVVRDALRKLFEVLDQRPERRDPYLESDLKEFPYVNGGLFAEKDIEFPQLDGEPLRIILEDMSEGFDWSGISPTIFGAVFEATLNPQTRHSGGMHYTSIENIHKVIDPLFLDGLNSEADLIISVPASRSRTQKLRALQKKLAGLKFLDPACGSGNFLTESYLSLRRLENRIIKALAESSYTPPKDEALIKVSISQFYGIEINDFAVAVARTALWIAESQMYNETQRMNEAQRLIQFIGDLLPLKSYNRIIEANALKIDWREVIRIEELNFVIGNPPFIGQSVRTKEQSDDMAFIWGKGEIETKLDYVICWYKKAIDCIKGSTVKVAFVSTNSICQGESVPTFWKKMVEYYGAVINFARRSFVWSSEAIDKAAIHCVIVGFSHHEQKTKFLFHDEQKMPAEYINQYLTTGKMGFLNSRPKPLDDVPPMKFGSMPRDGGGFVLSEEERKTLMQNEPLAEKWVRLYLGAEEFLKKKKRYCLWLLGANPAEISKCPTVKQRVDRVRAFRLASKAASTRKFAETPSLFCQIAQPSTGSYIAVPETSSERRRYIPLGFLSADVIASNLLFLIPDASLFHFGVLESNVHMAWMRTVCGRLKSDYRYSKDIVYNNFPWPDPTEVQRTKIEQTAQAILDARGLYPDASLADLYDPITMPPELLKAHQANDRAVMQAYGMPIKDTDEAACVAWLMKLYQEKVGEQ